MKLVDNTYVYCMLGKPYFFTITYSLYYELQKSKKYANQKWRERPDRICMPYNMNHEQKLWV